MGHPEILSPKGPATRDLERDVGIFLELAQNYRNRKTVRQQWSL